MKKIDFIIGLPGSGKTTLMEKYDDDWVKVDDASINFIEMIEALTSDAEKIVIVDPKLCVNNSFDIRREIGKYCNQYDLSITCFENNLEQCLINCNNRKDKEVSNQWVKWMSSQYDPSSFNPVQILEVYNEKICYI